MLKKKKISPNLQKKYHDYYTTDINGVKKCRVIYFNDKEQPKNNLNRIITSKYGILSFLPRILVEQMKHFSSQYFLVISVLQQIPGVSPLGRYTTIIPLTCLMILSGIRSFFDDIKRRTADNSINNRYTKVLRNGNLIHKKWSDIGVGDILKIEKNSIFPADLVLISSSELDGMCFIETTNLDGENKLKTRHSLSETLKCTGLNDLTNLDGVIECEMPNKLLNKFTGSLTIQREDPAPLDYKQLLLRGAVLRNVKWIYGVVVYSGHETKLMLNQIKTTLKRSKVDIFLNSQMKIIFQCILVICLICSICCTLWSKNHSKKHWYIQFLGISPKFFLFQTITYFIIFHNSIPISLRVYIEIVRWIEAWFIDNDLDMYHEETDTPALVKSPNLNDELGQVKYIFSDKTGSLTKNIMELKFCSIAGKLYNERSWNTLNYDMVNQQRTKDDIIEFLRTLAICHTAIPEKRNDNEILYYTSSSDEQALLNGSKLFGYIFQTRSPKSITITANGIEEKYEILSILKFTSARKRMSVIVRSADSKIKLYCKGADSEMLKLLSDIGKKYEIMTKIHLKEFACAGFRTLCYGYADISEIYYEKWKSDYLKTSTIIQNREEAQDKIAAKIEKDLILTGATAVEDKLQDNVPETIQAFLDANINIWMLTGDKQETAINIGISTNIIKKGVPLIVINESNYTACKKSIHSYIRQLGPTLNNRNHPFTLVIDGQSLAFVLSGEIKRDFLKLSISCKTLICCRLTPSQKAELVELVTKATNDVTLAVGDGSSDVPMIQKANIGVGISGLEGYQASSAADYSIAQFKYLSKLIFVHGAWNHDRVCKMIYYCYYKTVCFYTLQLWFAIYSGWSGKLLFDRWIICTYNIVFTAAPPLAIGIFNTVCSAETRLKYPYMYTQINNKLNTKTFWKWVLNGICHSFLIFWYCLFILKHEIIWNNGYIGDFSILGNCIYTCVLTVVCLKAGLLIQSWNFIVHLTIWSSILSWFIFVVAYSRLAPFLYYIDITIHLNDVILMSSPVFWLTLVLITCFSLMLDVTIMTIQKIFCKSITQKLRKTELQSNI
ncbi:probable phospholipid-transporting ATPase IA isoform X2 [Daktulosphaira vitifoliae]|uniref:probable phospholipid-transporting ATPase IA isoform X2 n=1 Tax=Daktulosphaira vitifoliae TaxID=58002 RepID=UPI0021AA3D3C|nr:probable phospholipid-transporting ATPase IA isoform X2 [Daktulosphaira vitifoliae]